ncbi:MAG: hypothetical protein ABW184_04830 [Sphingobium sp.]
MKFTRLAPLALLLPFAVPVAAQLPEERIQAVVVYGNDSCPLEPDGTIVVCARKPEGERFRIPKDLRTKETVTVGGPGWAANVQSLEAAGRVLLPNSCSSVGTNGFTGCSLAMLQQWYAERQLEGRSPRARD